MRNAFAEELERQASENEQVVLLSGDIGNRLFDTYKKRFPDRFYNCGVAEANMASVAAGLAMSGLRPITYTITPFNTTRCLEQIRVDICYHNQPVIIVGVGAGLSYSQLGCTHHSCEDVSFLRSLPNMTVLCPADAVELKKLFRAALTLDGPVYIRIGKKGEPVIIDEDSSVQIGKGHLIKPGSNLCILSMGNMLPTALEVSNQFDSCQVISMHTIKPLDKVLLRSLFSTFETIVSLEEHSLIGGLSSSIAEWMIDEKITHPGFLRFGTPDLFPHSLGTQTYMRKVYSIDAQSIVSAIQKHLTQEGTLCTQKLQY